MLTKSLPASCDNSHDHALAEHHEHAEEIGQRSVFPEHRDGTLPDSAVRSSRYIEGPELLEGRGGPALSRDRMSSFTGQPSIKGRNESIRMMLLCAIHFGITFTWYGLPVENLSILHAPRYWSTATTAPQMWPV